MACKKSSFSFSNFLILLTGMFFLLSCGSSKIAVKKNHSSNYQSQSYNNYIRKYSSIAVDQMKRFEIPASITLAQGLLESGAGNSTLARKSNNHFGIKCHRGWKGRKVYHNDDRAHECFRAYPNVHVSYEDHSRFLISSPRYGKLFSYKITDYRKWAKGLKSAGYATNPNYANILIGIIENYKLYRYDRQDGALEAAVDQMNYTHKMGIANEIVYLIVRNGDTFKSLSAETGISASRIRKYNELDKSRSIEKGDVLYLHSKKKKAAKICPYHIVKAGDSMYLISQRYGIRLKYLFKRNHLSWNYIPEVGDRLKLR